MDDGRPAAQGHVVAVEGDVEIAERDVDVVQLGQQLAQARGEDGAASVDPDERQLLGVPRVLRDLVRDAGECAPHGVAVEDDLGVWHVCPSWPHRTGLKERRAGCEASNGRGGAPAARDPVPFRRLPLPRTPVGDTDSTGSAQPLS